MSEHSIEHLQRHREEVETLKAATTKDDIDSNEIALRFRYVIIRAACDSSLPHQDH